MRARGGPDLLFVKLSVHFEILVILIRIVLFDPLHRTFFIIIVDSACALWSERVITCTCRHQ